MRKTFKTFSILIFVVGLVMAPALACTPPTEVEKTVNLYYFKIQGKPATQPHNPPAEGEAKFTYKNLSPETQVINIIVEVTVGGYHYFWNFPASLGPGEVLENSAPEDFGVLADFEIWIDGLGLVYSGTIQVRPPS